MSSTSGSQNLLTNIFRPAYRYEIPTGGSTAVFVPTLDVSNIDVLATNSVTAFTAAIGDENENVYVGSNAGNAYSNLRGCSNVTAVGYAAASNISNTTNSVYIGYTSGANALDSSVNIAIGPNTKGNGISNIYIGSNTGSLGTGSNNILIGHNLTGSNLSNTLLIGPTPTIYGNLNTRKVGIGRDPSYNMDISGDSRITYRLGVGMEPGKAVDFANNPLTNVPHSLDVSGYSFIRGALGINADPADYTFNLVGNMKFDDGAGRIIMQKDPCGNSVFSFESYAPGKKAIFSIAGDICASSVVAPGSTFTGNVTACNVIATADLSGVGAYVTNIRGTRVFGEDVSGLRGRFDRVDITDISGSTGTVTTLTATTFSSTNFTTANIVLPGYLRDSLTPSTLDISGGNISNSGTTRSANFITASSNSLNTLGGVTLSNNNITYGGAISNTNAGANNNIGGVRLSNNTISNSGSTTSANFFGTAANSNNIGGVTLSNGIISNLSTTNNSIGGVTLCNGNITGTFQGAIATSNAVISGYVRNALTPNEFDISGGNIRNTGNIISTGGFRNDVSNWTIDISGGNIRSGPGSVSNPASAFVLDPSAGIYRPGANQFAVAIGGIQRMVISNGNVGIGRVAPTATLDVSGDVSANGLIGSTYIRDKIIPSTLDISGGNIRNTGNIISTGGFRNATSSWTTDISGGNIVYAGVISNSTATSSNSIGGVILSNQIVAAGAAVRNDLTPSSYDLSVNGLLTSNVVLTATATGYIRNAPSSWNIDMSGGNISNSATTRSSNFIGTATASNNIGGVALNNGVISNGSTTSNNIGGVALNNGTISNLAASSNNIGGIVLSGNRMVLANGTAAAPSFGFTAEATTGLYLNAVGSLDVAVSGTRFATFAGTALTMSNNNVFSGPLLSSYIRNATTPTLYDISGGRVRTAVGSVANPAFGFLTTDISAGMYLAAANQLGIAVAGTARMLIDNSSIAVGTPGSTGKTALFEIGGGYDSAGTGIARSFPAMAFHFGDGVNGGYRHFIRSRHNAASNTPTNSIDIFTNNTNTAEGSSGPGTGNSLAMSIASTGVGVGLSNPTYALDVSGVIRSSNAGVIANSVGIGTVTPLGPLDVFSGGIVMNRIGNITANTDVSAIVEGSSRVGMYWQKGSNNNNCGVSFRTLTNNILTERMRIDANTGYIGVYTTGPQYVLDISAGNLANQGISVVAQNAQLNLRDPGNSITNGLQIYQSTVGQGIYSASALPFHIWTFGSIRMSVSADGNVGIGTTNQGYRLDVASDSAAKAAINMSTWPRTSSTGTSMFIRGYQNFVGSCLVWSNPTVTFDANLGTWSNDATNGSYFICRRSGIWAITAVMHSSNQNASMFIDVSTNLSNTSHVGPGSNGNWLAFNNTGYFIGNLAYTGFLPSNSSRYIKFYVNGPNTAGTGTRLNTSVSITFLYETPVTATGSNVPFTSM